jgi:hypothetical protein
MPSISRFHGITIRMFFNEDFHPREEMGAPARS